MSDTASHPSRLLSASQVAERTGHFQLVFGPSGCSSGGLSLDVSTLASRLADRGHTVSVLTTTIPGGGRLPDYVSFGPQVVVHRLALAPLGSKADALSLAVGAHGVIRQESPDIVHVFSLVPNYLHGAVALSCRRLGIPLVLSPMMHPVRLESWSDHGVINGAMKVFDKLAPRWAARADLIVAATSDEREYFSALGAKRCVIAPPGISPGPLVAASEADLFRDRLGIDRCAPLIVSVAARDEPRKGLDVLQEVARALERECPTARILMIGIGTSRLHGPNVIYTGRLTPAQLTTAYAASDVAFIPSRYEAFSRVVIEAWEQATPVVVTDGVGLAHEVRDRAGLVVPRGDPESAVRALMTLLTNNELASQFGRTGRQISLSTYGWEQVVRTLEEAYFERASVSKGTRRDTTLSSPMRLLRKPS